VLEAASRFNDWLQHSCARPRGGTICCLSEEEPRAFCGVLTLFAIAAAVEPDLHPT